MRDAVPSIRSQAEKRPTIMDSWFWLVSCALFWRVTKQGADTLRRWFRDELDLFDSCLSSGYLLGVTVSCSASASSEMVELSSSAVLRWVAFFSGVAFSSSASGWVVM